MENLKEGDILICISVYCYQDIIFNIGERCNVLKISDMYGSKNNKIVEIKNERNEITYITSSYMSKCFKKSLIPNRKNRIINLEL